MKMLEFREAIMKCEHKNTCLEKPVIFELDIEKKCVIRFEERCDKCNKFIKYVKETFWRKT